MAYTDEQKRRLQTFPANKITYETVSFENKHTDPLHLLVSGKNGPYENMTFTLGGNQVEFRAVSCSVPVMTDQYDDDNSLGTVAFGRVGSEAFQFLSPIDKKSVSPLEKVIKVTVRRWESDLSTIIFEQVCYADNDGVAMDQDNVTVDLAFDNPAFSTAVAFFDPLEYPGMAYSDQR